MIWTKANGILDAEDDDECVIGTVLKGAEGQATAAMGNVAREGIVVCPIYGNRQRPKRVAMLRRDSRIAFGM